MLFCSVGSKWRRAWISRRWSASTTQTSATSTGGHRHGDWCQELRYVVQLQVAGGIGSGNECMKHFFVGGCFNNFMSDKHVVLWREILYGKSSVLYSAHITHTICRNGEVVHCISWKVVVYSICMCMRGRCMELCSLLCISSLPPSLRSMSSQPVSSHSTSPSLSTWRWPSSPPLPGNCSSAAWRRRPLQEGRPASVTSRKSTTRWTRRYADSLRRRG